MPQGILKKHWMERFPDGIVLLFGIVILVGIMSYIVPAGKFESMMVNGRKLIDPASFHYVAQHPVGLFDLFISIPAGMQNASALIFMILLIGGAIRLFESTGAISGAIGWFARRFGQDRGSWVLVLITSFFACLGAFPGMMEAAIPFAPLCVGIALSLGYDVVVGMSIAVLGINLGWTAGPTNPWTVGIGHNLAGLPMFSGIELRMVIFFVFLIICNVFILRYAAKVKKDPSKSIVWDLADKFSSAQAIDLANAPLTGRHKVILFLFVVTLGTIIFGTLQYKWGIPQMSALYIIGGIAAGIVAGYSANKISDTMIEGGRNIFGAVVAVGLARAIGIVMDNASITDTIIYYLSLPLQDLSPVVTGVAMFIVQSILNLFVPSGSGLAVLTLPIMLPLSDIVHLNKQIAILAFQFGDGMTNICFPTVAVLIAYLTYTKVPFPRWLQFITPYVCVTCIVASLFLVVAVMINYGPF
ncbi:MAG: hypothetical protein H6Q76_2606 [Firmicutes bacterium]|nr:hypothetical protein [Bacillota bacterium]